MLCIVGRWWVIAHCGAHTRGSLTWPAPPAAGERIYIHNDGHRWKTPSSTRDLRDKCKRKLSKNSIGISKNEIVLVTLNRSRHSIQWYHNIFHWTINILSDFWLDTKVPGFESILSSCVLKIQIHKKRTNQQQQVNLHNKSIKCIVKWL